MSTVIIGCKLPNGIVLHGTEDQPILLNGMNTAMIQGGYGLTHVDEIEAAYLFSAYKDFAPVVSKAIFTHNTDKVGDILAMGTDLQGERTGFEGMDPTKPAPGLKPDGDMDKQLAQAQQIAPPVRAPKAKADKAAALEAAQAQV